MKNWRLIFLAVISLFAVEPVRASASNNSCMTEPLDKQPRSVTIITRSQIEQQAILTRDLNQILNRVVPGYKFSRLRGSRPTVLIDGVPLARLRTIDPSIIERVEVIPQQSDRCFVE